MHVRDKFKLPKFDSTVDVKVPAGHMVVGVSIANKPDIMSEKTTPINGLLIMKRPNSLSR